MTKKEFLKKEFLVSRGYVEDGTLFGKIFVNNVYAIIDLTASSFEVYNYKVIREQKDIDNLQIAFNKTKRDFEEVMELED